MVSSSPAPDAGKRIDRLLFLVYGPFIKGGYWGPILSQRASLAPAGGSGISASRRSARRVDRRALLRLPAGYSHLTGRIGRRRGSRRAFGYRPVRVRRRGDP